ncbi:MULTISPECIES: N-acetyltransferase [Pseudomonas]|jgi:RimJ/RimL family protein N-acetyltransferase|uniref:N-acetyltransferase n=1 Tax=Pseudomonas TaxID=286 RepID=UPI000CEEAAA5|nr:MULTISPECIES: N-acetyltransferase [Pseudomonas]MDD1954049.1 N-acetyltransferase [Pseudomonas sp. 8209]PPS63884.1 N-acetyltransferase [Pseudomonas sp. BRM28]PPS64088.1 N-acetyltransferase [Pseudomonas sp. BRM28]
MGALQNLRDKIRRKGLRRVARTLWERHVFYHWELLWMERDLVSAVPPHNLRPHKPVRLVTITEDNAVAFARHFGDRVQTMAELAREGHTGHMYLDDADNAVAFIWGSKRDYLDRHYYGCTFPVKEGEFFEFGGEMTPSYFGTRLSVDAQVNLWAAMQAQGCNKVVDVVETHNVPAMKLHLRMGYHEQGRVAHVYCLFGRWKFFRETTYSGSRLEQLRKPRAVKTAAAPA